MAIRPLSISLCFFSSLQSARKPLTSSSACSQSPPLIQIIRVSLRNHMNCLQVKSWIANGSLCTISFSLSHTLVSQREIERYSRPKGFQTLVTYACIQQPLRFLNQALLHALIYTLIDSAVQYISSPLYLRFWTICSTAYEFCLQNTSLPAPIKERSTFTYYHSASKGLSGIFSEFKGHVQNQPRCRLAAYANRYLFIPVQTPHSAVY